MISKYHNHKPQTNPRHREKEPHNNHQISGRQNKQNNQLSLPHQMVAKLESITKHRKNTESHNGSNNEPTTAEQPL